MNRLAFSFILMALFLFGAAPFSYASIDLLEKKFEAYKERSVASNLVASDINITSGATTTVRGSQLNAKDKINIDSDELNILASQDINNSKESSDHKHLNISIGTSSATSGSVSMVSRPTVRQGSGV